MLNKYFKITILAPIPGMDEIHYVKKRRQSDAEDIAQMLVDAFAFEWWEENMFDEDEFTEEEWYDECDYEIERISKKEFLNATYEDIY